MYQVIFNNNSSVEITDNRAEKILLFEKQGMLSGRQKAWLRTVKDIVPIRAEPDQHTLALTKDMTCECPKCQ